MKKILLASAILLTISAQSEAQAFYRDFSDNGYYAANNARFGVLNLFPNPVYYLEDLEQGNHMIRAMLSVRMKDSSIVNLFGEQKVFLSGDDIDIKLPLQKLKV